MIGLVLAAILLAATGLRFWGLFTDFWLDEIWSLYFASSLTSPLDVLTKIHHDNNNPLITLYLHLVGPQGSWVAYRALSFTSGTLSVALLSLSAFRRDRLEGVAIAALTGASFLMITYSSEARGYAPAIFFAIAAFLLMNHHLARRGRGTAVLIGVTSCAGFLSHLSFVFPYSGLLVWSGLRLVRSGLASARLALEIVKLHALPLSFLTLLYFIDVRKMMQGGGPEYPLGEILQQAVALTLGSPGSGMIAGLAITAALLIVALELIARGRDGDDSWVFFLTTLGLAPAVVLLVYRPTYLQARHFFVCVPFFLLLVARCLCRCARRHRVAALAAVGLLALYLVGNGLQTVAFLRDGRGHYRDAVTYLASETPGNEITLGGDHDFRHQAVLCLYARYLPAGKQITYLDGNSWTPATPEWVVIQNSRKRQRPTRSLVGRNGARYQLERRFRHSGASGGDWFVYRRAGDAPGQRPFTRDPGARLEIQLPSPREPDGTTEPYRFSRTSDFPGCFAEVHRRALTR